MLTAIRYHFTQALAFPAADAYAWCTDFDPNDNLLMGQASMRREVTRITDAVILLTDAFSTSTETVEKQKLVHLYPDRLSWISTHLSGPNKYSQFQYKIEPRDDSSSVLSYTALHMEHKEIGDAKSFAKRLCNQDASLWKLLAKAMEKDNKQRAI